MGDRGVRSMTATTSGSPPTPDDHTNHSKEAAMTQATQGADVVDELTADHREATELLDQILTTSDPETRRDMADTVITELVRHSVAEEMYVYPVIEDLFPDGKEVVRHDTEEHKELERTMKELEGCAADDPRFSALVSELRDQLRHHVTDEETEQFPELRARVPREKLVQMRKQVDTAKKIAPT